MKCVARDRTAAWRCAGKRHLYNRKITFHEIKSLTQTLSKALNEECMTPRSRVHGMVPTDHLRCSAPLNGSRKSDLWSIQVHFTQTCWCLLVFVFLMVARTKYLLIFRVLWPAVWMQQPHVVWALMISRLRFVSLSVHGTRWAELRIYSLVKSDNIVLEPWAVSIFAKSVCCNSINKQRWSPHIPPQTSTITMTGHWWSTRETSLGFHLNHFLSGQCPPWDISDKHWNLWWTIPPRRPRALNKFYDCIQVALIFISIA